MPKRQDGYITNESGSWLGHYSKWILDHATGKRKRQQKAFVIGSNTMKKSTAREKLRERIVQEIGITADSRVTLSWFIEHRWKPLQEGGWRESTKKTNEEILKVLTDRFGTTPIEDFDLVQLQGWLNSIAKTRSGSAVKHLRIFVRSIMQAAVDQDYIRRNHARMLRTPKLKPVSKPYLSLEQIKALLKAAQWQRRDLALLRFVLATALRPSELFALRWRHVDFAGMTITIVESVYRGKIRPYLKTTEEGEAQRLVVPEMAMNALAEWYTWDENDPAPDDFVFPNTEGGFLSKENYQQRVLKDLADRAEIPKLNFQILRRTVATHAQHLGSPKDIATLMRHKQVETAQREYVQVIDQTVREVGDRLTAKMLT